MLSPPLGLFTLGALRRLFPLFPQQLGRKCLSSTISGLLIAPDVRLTSGSRAGLLQANVGYPDRTLDRVGRGRHLDNGVALACIMHAFAIGDSQGCGNHAASGITRTQRGMRSESRSALFPFVYPCGNGDKCSMRGRKRAAANT